MAVHKVYPAGEKGLFELFTEAGSPGAEYLFSIGGTSYVFEGLAGVKLGDAFFAADPNYINVLTIRGMGKTHYQIDIPITDILVLDSLTMWGEEAKCKVKIDTLGFTIDVGESQKPAPPLKSGPTPSPW